jgi:isopentenyldiphosphate isomerase
MTYTWKLSDCATRFQAWYKDQPQATKDALQAYWDNTICSHPEIAHTSGPGGRSGDIARRTYLIRYAQQTFGYEARV